MALTTGARTGMSIDDFKTNFQTGARSYLFYCKPIFPSITGLLYPSGQIENTKFLVRSTQLPSVSLEEQATSWQGFEYKTAGKYTYDNWTISFNVDAYANIRNNYALWCKYILDPATNKHAYPNQYFVDQEIELLGLDFVPIAKYTLKYAFPSQVGDVNLDYTNTDFAQFDVTYSYTYFTHEFTSTTTIPTT
jgi:hypothetical protein